MQSVLKLLYSFLLNASYKNVNPENEKSLASYCRQTLKLLQINLVFQDIVDSEVVDSYENEFLDNGCTCSHIEIIIKSYKWIDIEVSTGIEENSNKSYDDLDTNVGCNSKCGTVFIEQLSNGNG